MAQGAPRDPIGLGCRAAARGAAALFSCPKAEVVIPSKLPWEGRVVGVQPRIRLTRSYDEGQHSYLGYLLTIAGTMGEETGEFLVGIGKAAQEKHRFQRGDVVRGQSVAVPPRAAEPAGFYRTSGLRLLSKAEPEESTPPPWWGVPPELPTYRERGHRRLNARTYEGKCKSCIWGCRMAVEMIIDQWNQSKRRHRMETFCYGPKVCPIYRAGAQRHVPGRKGMSWEEPDWVDEQNTEHRGPED